MIAWKIVILLALVIAVLVIFAVVFGAGRRLRLMPGRRPRPLHLVVRIICGSLGALIVGAIAVGTLKEAQSVYAPGGANAAATVHVPTKPAPPLPVPKKDSDVRAIDKARLLVQLVLVDRSGPQPAAIEVQEFQLRWPEDRGKEFGRRMTVKQGRRTTVLTPAFALTELESRREYETKEVELQGHGISLTNFVTTADTWSATGSTGGPPIFGVVQRMWCATAPSEPGNDPLSVVRNVAPAQRLELMGFMTLLAQDDPLKPVSLDEFLKSKEGAMGGVSRAGGVHSTRSEDWVHRMPMRGFLLAEHTGLSALLLLVAAILLSMCFARRGLAFAGTLAAMVLYVALLDRVVLGVHMSKLEDAKAPVGVRCTACIQASDTFFYRETARERIQAVGEDAKASAPLREQAKTVLGEMKQQDRD